MAVDADTLAAEEAAGRVLIAAMACGDESALQAFHRRFAPTVRAFCRQRLRDADSTEAIVNHIMADVWYAAGRFRGEARVTTWLLGIAHHRIGDLLRERARHAGPAGAPALLAEPAADEGDSAQALLERHQDTQRLHRALRLLPPEQREVVHLTYFGDLALEEVAHVVGIPLGTVKSRLHHARRALRRRLGAEPIRADPPQ